MALVFLHVGLPKTGTTSLQAALHDAAPRLAAAGVLVPGGSHHAQRMAAFDLLGQRARGGRAAAAAGAFRRLVTEIDAWDGERVVVSEEELGLARPAQARRVVRALGAHEVHVVLGVRDLGRTLVSAWQQGILMGDATPWSPFVAAVRDPAQGDVRTGASFHLRHDPLRVLDTWGTCVPPARVRIVTAPPAGSPTEVLLARFAEAAELPAGFWRDGERPLDPVALNRSPGTPQIEVVRRLNAAVGGHLTPRRHRVLLERGVKPALAPDPRRPLLLPREDLAWTRERGRRLVEELRRRGHPVHGDLADLLPDEAATTTRRPDDLTAEELLTATEAVLASVARLPTGGVPPRRRTQAAQSGPVTALASSARAATFGLEKAALVHARDHRLLARAVRAYLRRSGTS